MSQIVEILPHGRLKAYIFYTADAMAADALMTQRAGALIQYKDVILPV